MQKTGWRRVEQKLRQATRLQDLKKIRSYGHAFSAAQDARRRSDLDGEIAALLRACELDRRPEALTMLAAAYRRCQRWADAERLYEEALALGDSPVARVGLAAVYRDQRRLQEAKSILEKVLRSNPNNGYALRALAGVYSDLEKPEEAVPPHGKGCGAGILRRDNALRGYHASAIQPKHQPQTTARPAPAGRPSRICARSRSGRTPFCSAERRSTATCCAIRSARCPSIWSPSRTTCGTSWRITHKDYSKATFQYKLLSSITGQGLLTSDGDFWLKQRRLAQPAFHRQHVAGFTQIMADATEAMLARWDGLRGTRRADRCGRGNDARRAADCGEGHVRRGDRR